MSIQETKSKYITNKLRESEQQEQHKYNSIHNIIREYIGAENEKEIENIHIGPGDGFEGPSLVTVKIKKHKTIFLRFVRDIYMKDNPWKVTRIYVNSLLRKRYFDHFIEALIFAGE